MASSFDLTDVFPPSCVLYWTAYFNIHVCIVILGVLFSSVEDFIFILKFSPITLLNNFSPIILKIRPVRSMVSSKILLPKISHDYIIVLRSVIVSLNILQT